MRPNAALATCDHADMTPGRIIFLNGTSSSGKSSIAHELLDILNDGVFFHANAGWASAPNPG